LLERAKRIKDQEQRKREWTKKRAEQEKKHGSEEQAINLGSQLRLDKFGYKSSQLHLGNFFKTRTAANDTIKEPWEDEDIDENSMLDVEPSDKITGSGSKKHTAVEHTTEIHDWADFLDSSTQIERELSGVSKTTPQACKAMPKRSESFKSIPSWNSDDMFDDDDLIELDMSIQAMQQPTESRRSIKGTSAEESHQKSKDTLLMPPPDLPSVQRDSVLMPPPKTLPPLRTSKPTMGPPKTPASRTIPAQTSRQNSLPTAKPPAQSKPSWAEFGISTAELETLVADEIVLSQWSGG